MDRKERRYQKDIEKHLDYDEMKLRKKARSLRKSAQTRRAPAGGAITEDNWEERHDRSNAARKRPSLESLIEELRSQTPQLETTREVGGDGPAAIVISVSSGRCRVFIEGREIDCIVPSLIAEKQKSHLAVGDRVDIEEESGVWRLANIRVRTSVLARPDPNNPRRLRLVAANVDRVVHVVSVKAPPLRPRLIDRYLIAIERGGAKPILCVNKTDLLDPHERAEIMDVLTPYVDLGVPVTLVSTKTGEGLDRLRDEVRGFTSALVGHSGVGKSSILNALNQELQLPINTLHRRGTGRHTTTASTLYDFGDGTFLIDTPGIREFGLWDLDRKSLREYFPEFAVAAESCRFTDCSHTHEPDCEVRRQVEEGELTKPRYDTYLRLYEDLA